VLCNRQQVGRLMKGWNEALVEFEIGHLAPISALFAHGNPSAGVDTKWLLPVLEVLLSLRIPSCCSELLGPCLLDVHGYFFPHRDTREERQIKGDSASSGHTRRGGHFFQPSRTNLSKSTTSWASLSVGAADRARDGLVSRSFKHAQPKVGPCSATRASLRRPTGKRT